MQLKIFLLAGVLSSLATDVKGMSSFKGLLDEKVLIIL